MHIYEFVLDAHFHDQNIAFPPGIPLSNDSVRTQSAMIFHEDVKEGLLAAFDDLDHSMVDLGLELMIVKD
jgi:hypothetical protein